MKNGKDKRKSEKLDSKLLELMNTFRNDYVDNFHRVNVMEFDQLEQLRQKELDRQSAEALDKLFFERKMQFESAAKLLKNNKDAINYLNTLSKEYLSYENLLKDQKQFPTEQQKKMQMDVEKELLRILQEYEKNKKLTLQQSTRLK